jgi:O-antigen/teichoic acid export membrane protein
VLLRRTLKNGIFSAMTQVVTLGLGLLFAGMTVRYLGEARAGFFLVAGLILGWFSVAGMGGFRAAAIQRLATLNASGDVATSRTVLGTVGFANLVIAVPFAVVSVAAFPILFSWSQLEVGYRNDALAVVVLGAVTFLIDGWSGTLRALYIARQRFDLSTYTSSAFGVLGNLARLLVLVRFRDMASLAVVNVLISAAWMVVDVMLTRRLLGRWIVPVWQREEMRPLMRFGLWAWGGDVLGAIATNVGSMVTTYYLGSAPLPYIAIPYRITLQVHMLLANTCFVLFPTLAAEGSEVGRIIERIDDRMRWFVAVTTWPLYAALALIGPLLLTALAGGEFAQHATVPLRIFCVLFAINGMNIAYSFASMAVGKIHPAVVCENAASLLTLVSNVVLIPWLGYIGSAWSSMWKVPMVLVQSVWTRVVLGLPDTLADEWRPYASPTVGVAVFALTAWLLGLSHIGRTVAGRVIAVALGGGIYAATVWYLEARLMPSYHRWQTVARALEMLKSRLTRRQPSRI